MSGSVRHDLPNRTPAVLNQFHSFHTAPPQAKGTGIIAIEPRDKPMLLSSPPLAFACTYQLFSAQAVMTVTTLQDITSRTTSQHQKVCKLLYLVLLRPCLSNWPMPAYYANYRQALSNTIYCQQAHSVLTRPVLAHICVSDCCFACVRQLLDGLDIWGSFGM